MSEAATHSSSIAHQKKPNFERRNAGLQEQLIARYTINEIGEVEDQYSQMFRERYRYLWNNLLENLASRIESGQSEESFVSQIRVATAIAMRESLKSDKDVMTGLPNRKAITEGMQRIMNLSIRQKKNVAVFYIDLDNFKTKVNDVFGHSAGDDVIKAVAEILKGVTRKYDMPGRLAGDEFLLVAPDVGDDYVDSIKKRFTESLQEEKFTTLKGFQDINLSIGMCIVHPREDTDISEIIGRAETAMTHGKSVEDGRVKIIPWKEGMPRLNVTSRR